jgi:predicted dehydrogenase
MKYKGAMIGFGNIAEKGHWPAYAKASAGNPNSPDIEIVAVMDPSPSRQEAARALKSDIRTYSSTAELYKSEKLDFVDICTPPSSHAALALEALDHDVHVLCEKPLVLKEQDYLSLAQAMKAHQRAVYTVHNWKCAPIIQRALSIIREGRIGPVWHVELFVLRDNVCKGTAQVQEDWRTDPSVSGGGILVDHGWHAFYLLTSFIGADPQAILSKMLFSENGSGLEEAVQALVQFPEADGYIHLTWRAKMRRNAINIQGLNGTLLVDDDRILLNARDGVHEELPFAALSAGSHHADWFESVLTDFVGEMKDPAQRGKNFREAGWCFALTSAAYMSNLQGFKSVEVSLPGSPKSQPALA